MATFPDLRAAGKHSAAKCALIADAVRGFGEVRFQVVGSSMLPSLWPGDIVLVRRCAFSELHQGQILQYIRSGLLITHRVAGKGGCDVLAQGDCNAHPDAPVTEAEIVGRVVSVERNGCPVDPAFTPLRRISAWFLRRSDLLVRVLLRAAQLRGLSPRVPARLTVAP
jgi:hypothetical protein